MPIHHVSPGRGLSWLGESLDMAGRRPATVLGAALLALVTAIVVAVVAVMVLMPGAGGTGSVGETLGRMLPLGVLMLALQPVLLGGLVSVVARIDRGEPTAATGVFAGFLGGRLLPLASLGLIQVAAAGLNLLLLDWLGGGDYLARYIEFLNGLEPGAGFDPEAVPQPQNAGLLTIANLFVNLLATALLAFSVAQVMLGGLGPLQALRSAFAGTLANLPAALLAGAVALLGLMLAAVVVSLVVALFAALGSLVTPLLGQLLGFSVLLLAMLAVIAMLAGATYLAWRDIFAGPGGSGARAEPVVEAEL